MPRVYTVETNPSISIHLGADESASASFLVVGPGRDCVRLNLGADCIVFVSVDQAAAIHSGIAQAQDDLRVRNVQEHGDGVRAHAAATV